MANKIDDKLLKCFKDITTCHVNHEIKNYTTFRVGGQCDLLTLPTNEEEIRSIIQLCKQHSINYLILGNGSNILVRDEGIKGVVILLSKNFSDITVDGEYVTACAGASLAKVCKVSADHGLTGLEFAYGIPANIGGAVYMNAGAYGGEMKDVLQSVTYLDDDLQLVTSDLSKLSMGYRHTLFSDHNYCIISATFKLRAGDRLKIRELMEETMAKRVAKQPLEYPSAGSTFKRPEGYFAAALIEECGLKGATVGGAMVSKKHSGFVINYDNASCNDILALIDHVKQTVLEKKGVALECEVRLIGG